MPHIYALTWMKYARGMKPRPYCKSFHLTKHDAAYFISLYHCQKSRLPAPDLYPLYDENAGKEAEPEELPVSPKVINRLKDEKYGLWMPPLWMSADIHFIIPHANRPAHT